mmetsp:Transcript_28492/g.69490  ORF Transcript_28492/g.69490 Transcript_28492/m.69490 type:complete len:126 (-) Transcript_28492:508-885(-)
MRQRLRLPVVRIRLVVIFTTIPHPLWKKERWPPWLPSATKEHRAATKIHPLHVDSQQDCREKVSELVEDDCEGVHKVKGKYLDCERVEDALGSGTNCRSHYVLKNWFQEPPQGYHHEERKQHPFH